MSERPATIRVVVIGGGVTGLAAAHRCLELADPRGAAVDLTLLEAGDRVGGTIRTLQRDGFLIDGPDNFITNKPWGLSLCRRLGIEDQLLRTHDAHRRALVVRRGRLVPIPEGFELMAPRRLGPVLRSPVLSWRGKLRLLAERFVAGKDHGGDGDESLASFVRRRFGREALDRLVQPLIGGIYTADPETLSLRATVPRFLDMETAHGSVIKAMRAAAKQGRDSDAAAESAAGVRYSLFVTFRHGMQTLTDALAARIGAARIQLNASVASLRAPNPADQAATWTVQLSAGRTLSADRVILAVPAYVAGQWLAPLDKDLGEALNAIDYASSAVVTCAYRRADVPHPLDAFGFVVPHLEHRAIIAGSFSSTKYAHRAPDGGVLLRAFLGGALQADMMKLTDDAMVNAVRDEFAQLLGVTVPPLLSVLSRYDRAMPQFHVGHLQRVAAIRQRAAALVGLELAGNAYDGVGIPDCIHSGEAAADRALGADTMTP